MHLIFLERQSRNHHIEMLKSMKGVHFIILLRSHEALLILEIRHIRIRRHNHGYTKYLVNWFSSFRVLTPESCHFSSLSTASPLQQCKQYCATL